MGKKVKKKARAVNKEKRIAKSDPTSQVSAPAHSTPSLEGVDAAVAAVKERKLCPHFDKGLDLVKVSSKLGSFGPLKCEDCREESIDRRASKAKGKQGKKKGGGSVDSSSGTKAIWVCLECGHFACGGIGFPTTPQSHAVRHARQYKHHLAIQYKNPHLRWCFPCSTLIPVETSEENGQAKDVLSEIVKLMKASPSEGVSIDVEDVWFGSGSVTSSIIENTALNCSDGGGGYRVRGLTNLGNTCFFNSILQNLLAMHKLRDHFLKMDVALGPLTVSLKKLFIETNPETGFRNVMTPKSLFGCVCAKAPQFRGFQQHDSHELLRCLLDGLSTEESSAIKQKSSKDVGTSPNVAHTFVDTIFGGRLCSTVSCLECSHSSIVYEPFLDLSLPIPCKRSPTKKAKPVVQPKKPKLPPKRSQRTRSKINRSVDLVHSRSESLNGDQTSSQVDGTAPVVSESLNVDQTSSQVEGAVPVVKDIMSTSVVSASSESTGKTAVNDENVSVSDNLLTKQETQNSFLCKNVMEKTVPQVEDMSWLDYLEPDTTMSWLDYLEPDAMISDYNLATQGDGNSVTKDAENENAYKNAGVVENTLESSKHDPLLNMEQADPLASNSTRVDYLEPELSNVSNMDSQSKAEMKDFVTEDATLNDEVARHGSESRDQVLPEESSIGTYYEEPLLHVQSSEVLLLPYKDETSTTEETLNKGDGVTVSSVGVEQDCLDFGGFGDLFNEPEDAEGPVMKPSSSMQANSSVIAGTGISVGNSSGSDPDEIDNTDTPISVERCVSLFTKPEFLSKDEHAWHCENCSKILLRQRTKMKKYKKSTSNVSVNGGEGGPRDLISGSGKDFPLPVGNMNLSNGINRRDVLDCSADMLVSSNGSSDVHLNCMIECDQKAEQLPVETLLVKENCKMTDALQRLTLSQNNLDDSCNIDDSGRAGCYNNNAQHSESDSVPGERESGGEDEESDPKSIKVKRDATKRILIDKAPPILTIHLKRFSQDARGRISKLHGHVDFRDTIDLRPYMHTSCTERKSYVYRLLGVVEHLGTMRGGHYVAYVRGGVKNNVGSEKENCGNYVWYYISDAHVREVSFEEVLRSEAYILFYEEI